MQIRLATEQDLPGILAIYNATIPQRIATADLEPVSVENRQEWFAKHTADQYPIFVIEKAETVIAWLSFQEFYARPAYHATAEISIYVDTNYRHQGIGSYLLSYALHHSPELGIKTLLGFIFGHNQPSLRLFTKFGFQEWGYLPRIAELDQIERDLVIVGKRLNF
jgi:L-amino acid N-acyltransferase YncA